VTGNLRGQKKPTFSPARDSDTIPHASGITVEYADTSEFDDRLLGYLVRSSSPEAHAMDGKVKPSPVRATTPIQEEAQSMASGRQSSHGRRKCVSVIAKDAVSPATLAAPCVSLNMCLPASACVSSTPDAHELSSTRPLNVAISILSVPESPVNVVTSHLFSSAIATHSIRRVLHNEFPISCARRTL
jgi:hypothetical protein